MSDDLLDQIDQVVLPGTGAGTLDQAYVPPSTERTELLHCPIGERLIA
ncbi:hypothetical protein [Streptomyces sp. Ag109_O5-10]